MVICCVYSTAFAGSTLLMKLLCCKVRHEYKLSDTTCVTAIQHPISLSSVEWKFRYSIEVLLLKQCPFSTDPDSIRLLVSYLKNRRTVLGWREKQVFPYTQLQNVRAQKSSTASELMCFKAVLLLYTFIISIIFHLCGFFPFSPCARCKLVMSDEN